MYWGAIRKAINSDIQKPLDVLIKETSSSGLPTHHTVFTSNNTFTVPAGVTTVYVTAVGGGGGGGGLSGSSNTTTPGGSGRAGANGFLVVSY